MLFGLGLQNRPEFFSANVRVGPTKRHRVSGGTGAVKDQGYKVETVSDGFLLPFHRS
jgi:hypothetical protein